MIKTKNAFLIAIGCFLIGLMMGLPSQTRVAETECPETLTENVSECETLMSLLEKENDIRKQIMEIDKQGLILGATAMSYCSDSFEAIGNLDFNEVERIATRINGLAPQINALASIKIGLFVELEEIE